jgi:hypothetical protein
VHATIEDIMTRLKDLPRALWRTGIALSALASFATIAHADSITADSGAPADAATPLDASVVAADGGSQLPIINVLKTSLHHTPGLIFVAPKTATAGLPQGPEIIDDQGRPIWFQSIGNGDQAADFRVQQYRGQSVLTWWQGSSHTGAGHGEGTDYIVDRAYHVIATVNAGNGLAADTHEFHLTPEGTAFITAYHAVPFDLSPVGGPVDGQAFDGVIQEIDVATGKVIFEWHSLEHIALDESHAPLPTASTDVYDYFHINAINFDYDGNLIVSARNAWAVYKIDRHSGEVLWRLAGTKSDYTLGANVAFAWQHNPIAAGLDTLRLFDNEASPAVLPASRVIWVKLDHAQKTATLLRSIAHPDALSAGSQGNSQALEAGHTFVGWGATGRFSEFDASGQLLFDANVPDGYDTYRAYRSVWHATPDTKPIATVQQNPDGSLTVNAIWNGATEVARWYVLGGADGQKSWPIGSSAWNGLDTKITISSDVAQVSVVAQDAFGHWLGKSEPVSVGD